MKACIVQPLYTTDYERSEEMFLWEMETLDKLDDSLDLIVFPEASDVPCLAKTNEQFLASIERFNAPLLEKAAAAAKRCAAVLFINAYEKHPGGWRNTTWAFDKNGEVAGHYYKQHLTPGEVDKRKLDAEYGFEHSEPTILEIDGIRYGFMTCYDFYFYEAFAPLARMKPDIIIGCSHQRSDLHSALELMTRFMAYNTNAYVVRASVSMGEDSETGGASMIATPRGDVLVDMGNRVGLATAEFDPHEKYYKPAGFGGAPSAHHEYIERGRRPWKYRPGGSAICRTDEWMGYPRVCAHRGFNSVAPENTMPAYGAAIGLGADEIEFDLWQTADGVIVSCHDCALERVSSGTGFITQKTYEELLACDFGVKKSPKFAGLKILTFEEILKRFACHTVMNIHLKPADIDVHAVAALIRKYDCEKWCYFMTGDDTLLEKLQREVPQIARCVGGGKRPYELVERALDYGATKIQLVKGKYTEDMIARAHEHGIRCNIFWSDDPDETRRMLDSGIDCILTNDFQLINETVKAWKAQREE